MKVFHKLFCLFGRHDPLPLRLEKQCFSRCRHCEVIVKMRDLEWEPGYDESRRIEAYWRQRNEAVMNRHRDVQLLACVEWMFGGKSFVKGDSE